MTYLVPEKVAISKTKEFDKWEIIHTTSIEIKNNTLISENEVRDMIVIQAKEMGANAIMNFSFEKIFIQKTRERSSRIEHHAKGILAIVGKIDSKGIETKEDLINNMNQIKIEDDGLMERQAIEGSKNRKKAFFITLFILAVIFISKQI